MLSTFVVFLWLLFVKFYTFNSLLPSHGAVDIAVLYMHVYIYIFIFCDCYSVSFVNSVIYLSIYFSSVHFYDNCYIFSQIATK